MTIKISLRKLIIQCSLEEMFERIEENGFELLPVLPQHLISLSSLTMFHGDHFDRIIISQGLSENIVIITSDDKFDDYNINRLWK